MFAIFESKFCKPFQVVNRILPLFMGRSWADDNGTMREDGHFSAERIISQVLTCFVRCSKLHDLIFVCETDARRKDSAERNN